ncbi:MAG: 50S ribosomal protein L4 [Ruminococcaceae bacterium]|nr:50S ribosomal protein L4 [Oscillospiraceae bacterium]
MLKVKVVDTAGKKVSDLKLAEGIFGIEPNKAAMHLAVVSYLAHQRQGTQSTLTRSEVSGGGKKPWRQKGTGRARQGSTRATQWIHGGIALGPKPRKYKVGMTKKTKRLALKSALSAKTAAEELVVLNEWKLDEIKTAKAAEVLRAVKAGKKTLIVLPEKDENIYKSARNIAGVKVATVNTINTYDILNANSLVVTEAAVKKIEEVYA